MTDELQTVVLKNGLIVRFLDQSNRYFGDFHRVCILVEISLPDRIELPAGLTREGACQKRELVRMGVPSAALAEVRKSLVDSFLSTARIYLEQDAFPHQLLNKLQQVQGRPIFQRNQD